MEIGSSNAYPTCTGFIASGSKVNGNHSLKINNCYSIGKVEVSAKNKSYCGGFVGVKSTHTKVTNSYWNIETSGWKTSEGGGEGKTTAQMKQQSTYVEWDFTNTWYMDEKTGYPRLQWERLIK